MRDYIFKFEQAHMLKLGLKLNELLLLDYLISFISSGEMKFIMAGGEKFYWISYKKILEDLPILDIGIRRLKKIIFEMEEKGVIKKHNVEHGKLYVSVDLDMIWGTKIPYMCKSGEQKFPIGGTKVPPIDNYNNKIKINIKTPVGLNTQNIMCNFYESLKDSMNETVYTYNLKDKILLDEFTQEYIVFNIKSADMNLFKKLYLEKIENALRKVVQE